MTASVDLTESGVFAALRTVLLGLIDSVEVVMGQDNRVAAPTGDFLNMTPLFRERLATNVTSYHDGYIVPGPSIRNSLQRTRFTIQIDAFGGSASDNVQIISTMFRDGYACDAFAAVTSGIQPLYTSDPLQAQFVNSAKQYESRWTVDVVLQANITVSIDQQFAGKAAIGLINVDATYPPGAIA
jgi:hypothetical protein